MFSKILFNQSRRRFSNNLKRFKGSNPWYYSPNKWKLFAFTTCFSAGFYFYSREEIPYLGKKRFIAISPSTEKAIDLGKMTYNQVTARYRHQFLPKWHPIYRRIQSVADKLIQSLENDQRYSRDWQLFVIDAPIENAFVIPGGQIFVFTGLLRVATSDDEIAAVIGHEMSHVILRHPAQGISLRILLGLARIALDLTLGMGAFFDTLGTFGFMLPYSRLKSEKEADHVGLLIMSRACYDPNGAKMEKLKIGASVPSLLATHPPHHERISFLNEKLAEANDLRRLHCNTEEFYQFDGLFSRFF
ncbi:hypothetical protein ROZALSC1DRAFT_30880 [Rozella allomycis CSF55]|uniref:Peptidase M48 domain-containing protein n=1 Tax=Rozella allomycis (strain CSF55) TaxID=988480 RepID=A0A075AS58_ROZAC|nr:Peptidase M48 domain-containing protein [Rozella allomycis CSF55]RKP17296.1 hypothetical protein ROZALSC1DRAFT_30880 [Rozella allomycis CSF55]|eukprot:EPZ31398.1 Peptidase M48 domain-containing protein [Rozella allomycis CSF55]